MPRRPREGSGRARPTFTLERLDEDGELALSVAARARRSCSTSGRPGVSRARRRRRIWSRCGSENRGRGLVVVGLDAKDFRRDARSFARRFDLTFPLVYDGPGETLTDYGVTGFPGDVRHRPRGPRRRGVRGRGELRRGSRAPTSGDRERARVVSGRCARPRGAMRGALARRSGRGARRTRRQPPISRPSSCARSARRPSTSRTRRWPSA